MQQKVFLGQGSPGEPLLVPEGELGGPPRVGLGESGLGDQKIESFMWALVVEVKDRYAGWRQVSGLISHLGT